MIKRKIFRLLLSVDDSLKKLFEYYTPLPVGITNVKLPEIHERVLAEDIVSPIDVPGFDRAIMDGYALKAADTFGADEENPIHLNVVGKAEPGTYPTSDVHRGDAVEVATGAPIPKGTNAVLMVEYTHGEGDEIQIFKPVVPGENIMAAGSDIMTGEIVLRKGQIMTPREMGVAAALGLTKIKVHKKPVVAIISTGNELVKGGNSLDYAKIYDINANSIAGAVIECGCESLQMGIVQDDADKMKRIILSALAKADLVLTSGSTSAGASDFLYRVIDELGEPGVLVHGLTLKPGKPTFLAVVNNKPLIGLPGYPTSALMIFNTVVRPILLKMTGNSGKVVPYHVDAMTAHRIYSAKGKRELLPVHLVESKFGDYLAYPVESGSGAISSMGMSDGFTDIPSGREYLAEGEKIQVNLFGSGVKPSNLVIIGSHCVGIDSLIQIMNSGNTEFFAKIVNTGSLGGLQAVKRGEADIAGIHLINEVTGEYNRPFLDKYGVTGTVSLVHGYRREQGLIISKGNPKLIRSLDDLLRDDVAFINRNPGSGTRILTDIMLNEVAKRKKLSFKKLRNKIIGYDIEAKSHSAVAAAVSQGRADVGVGIRTNAEIYGLYFILLRDEQYDFVVPNDRLDKDAVKRFLDTLKSKRFSKELERKHPGLRTTENTGSIIT